MYLQFNKMKAVNHTPFKNLEIDFITGKTVIKGKNLDEFSSNGSGKSTIFEILYWTMFGKLLRDNSQPVTATDKKAIENTVWLKADGDSYKIVRNRKGATVVLNFYKDEECLSLGTTTLTQDLICKILQIDPEIFVATTLFDSSKHTSFATMGDKKQKELFVKILGLDFWERCTEEATQLLTKAKVLKSEKSSLYIKERSKLEETRARHGLLKEKIKQLQPVNREDYKAVDMSKQEKELSKLIEDNENDICRLELLEASEFAAIQARNDFNAIESEIRILKLKKSEISDKMKVSEKRIDSLNDAKCIECGQNINVKRSEVEKETNKFLSIQKKLNNLVSDLKKETDKTKALKTGIDSHNWEEVPGLKKKIMENKYSISTLKSSIKSNSKAEENYQKAVIAFESKKETMQNSLAEYEVRGKELHKSTISLGKSKEKVVDKLEQLEYLIKMYGRSGIQVALIRGIEEPLNGVLADYMTSFGFKNSKVQLSTYKTLKSGITRDQISVSLMNGATKRAFTTFSEGEKRRLDLVFFLALRDMLSAKITTNLLILDEVINNLDPSGISGLKEILDSKFKGHCIWIAIPTDSFEWSCQNHWTVVKKRKISCLQVS